VGYPVLVLAGMLSSYQERLAVGTDYVAVNRDFYNRNAEAYATNTAQMLDLDWLEKFASYVRPGGRILDVGSASGRDSAWFASRGFEVVGIDIAESLVKMATVTVPGARFAVMNLMDLDFEDQSFDGIWCSCVLLHIPRSDAPVAIQKMASKLRTDGVFYVLVKEGATDGLEEDSRYENAVKFSSYFEASEIRTMLKSADLEILEISDLHKRVDDYRASERIFALARK
jgi:SAM-dependent methyltransferase